MDQDQTESVLVELQGKFKAAWDAIRDEIVRLKARIDAEYLRLNKAELDLQVCEGALATARALKANQPAPVIVPAEPSARAEHQVPLGRFEKPVICPQCGHASRYRSQLKRHIKNNHAAQADEILRRYDEIKSGTVAVAAEPPPPPPLTPEAPEGVGIRRKRVIIPTTVAEERLEIIFTHIFMLGAGIENGTLRNEAGGFRYGEAMYAAKLLSELPPHLQYLRAHSQRVKDDKLVTKFRLSKHIGEAIWNDTDRQPTESMRPTAKRIAGYLAKLLARYMPDIVTYDFEKGVEKVYAEAKSRYAANPIKPVDCAPFVKGTDAENTLADFGERVYIEMEREENRGARRLELVAA